MDKRQIAVGVSKLLLTAGGRPAVTGSSQTSYVQPPTPQAGDRVSRAVDAHSARRQDHVTAIRYTTVVLDIVHTVTAPGSFVPDSPMLTPTGKAFIDRLRSEISDQLYLRCDGYTAVWPPSPVDAHTLSAERAIAVCALLQRGLAVLPPRIVPHGQATPIATNSTACPRGDDRRFHLARHKNAAIFRRA
jgi:outer membrane protein OmpA-like peptidoglycan-associated protein